MPSPDEILKKLLQKAMARGQRSAVDDAELHKRIDFVCRCLGNRAGVRLLMSCMLAKLDRPDVDPRKPYTEIGSKDAFSGRTYDEQYIGEFITTNRLPCNSTTAFLTPALRNQNSTLTTKTNLVGRPPRVYQHTLELLAAVHHGQISAETVLLEVIRVLICMRDERQAQIDSLLESLNRSMESLPLSTEAIVTLLQQHLDCKNSSRLPVLMVAAAYQSAASFLGEQMRPLQSHLSADEQSGAMGDLEICLVNDEEVVTVYEMKSKRVTCGDIDRALQKIIRQQPRIDNYIFITTDSIDEQVREYAAELYERSQGTEIAILDCIGFVRHFLHLFHRLRIQFLETYQQMVLAEPESAVNQPLKLAFLSLRQSAETDE